jgi:hypothetical protein
MAGLHDVVVGAGGEQLELGDDLLHAFFLVLVTKVSAKSPDASPCKCD